MPKITKRLVDTLVPVAEKDNFVWDTGDGSMKGFGIRMKPSGVAAYIIQYRNAEGRTRRLALGKVGVLAPDEARDLARQKLASVSRGSDPSADRHSARDEITVAELCDEYLKQAKEQIKASTLKSDKGRIECHIKPLIGRRAVKGLTQTDIERLRGDIAAGRTAKPKRLDGRGKSAEGGQHAATRTVATLSLILSFAQRRRIISENPAIGVKKFKDVKNKRFLSSDEIKALGRAMRTPPKPEDTLLNSKAIAAIKALLVTGCRRNEILSLPKEWLDSENRCIRFGDTKSGAQLRPIGASAVKLLKSQLNNKSPWVFPADRGSGHFIGLPRVFNKLCVQAGIKGARIHTLRHTFAAMAAELNFSELTIAGLLGHTVPGVTARYAHVPDSALITAADRVSARMSAFLEGKAESAEILPLGRKTLSRT